MVDCGLTDIACNIQNVFLPLLIPVVLLVVIVVMALLVPGRKFKVIMLLVFLIWVAYYVAPLFGYAQFRDWLHGLLAGGGV